VLFRFATDITDLYSRIGLEVVSHKSHIVGPTVEDFAFRSDGFQLSTTGTIHVGVPIGTVACRRNQRHARFSSGDPQQMH
jgi:hypothetical protein